MLKRTPGNVPRKKKIPLSFSRETQICQFLNRWCVRAHQFRCTWKLTVSQPCGDPGLPLLDHYQHGNRTGESSLKIIKSSSSPAARHSLYNARALSKWLNRAQQELQHLPRPSDPMPSRCDSISPRKSMEEAHWKVPLPLIKGLYDTQSAAILSEHNKNCSTS